MKTSAAEDASLSKHDDEQVSQYLTFQLGDDSYMLDILQVKEIFEYEHLTPVPMVPDFIRGVLNLRGQVVPVIDLSARFGGPQIEVDKKTCIIILEVSVEIAAETGDIDTELELESEIIELGIMVDMVNRVVDLSNREIEPPPSFGAAIRTDFILGMGKVEGEFVIFLDITKVLSATELMALDVLQDDDSAVASE